MMIHSFGMLIFLLIRNLAFHTALNMIGALGVIWSLNQILPYEIAYNFTNCFAISLLVILKKIKIKIGHRRE